MRVLFTQGYPREKMPFTMLVSQYIFFLSANQLIINLSHDKDALLLKAFTNYFSRQEDEKKKEN